MRRDGEAAIFWLTATSAAAALISIAIMEILLTAAVLLWIYKRPVPLAWPSYFLPLAVFVATTLLSLALSPDPSVGWHPVQKFVLFSIGFLTAAFVTTEWRAKVAYKLLLTAATAAAIMAILQFVVAEVRFLKTGELADDPTLVNRITGPLGHWLTFSGVQLLVWCAAIPAIPYLSRKWIAAVSIVGASIVLSNTRGVWLGAVAGFALAALALPRRVFVAVLIPMIVVVLAASPFIYRRVSMSLDKGLATNYSRMVYLTVGERMIRDHPLFGVGPERVDDEFPNYYTGTDLNTFYYGHLHNNILQIGAERGLICLAAFLWFLVELYRSLMRFLKNMEENSRWVVFGSVAALTGFIVSGMTEYNFGDSEVLVLLLFLVTIPFGLAIDVQKNPYSESR
jgi:O-antigen ligase